MRNQTCIEVSAPGRVELLGNHTDYNQGLVLSMAIERWTKMRSCVLQDGHIVLHSLDLDQTWKGNLQTLQPQKEPRWVNYILGVIARLQELGYALPGLELEIKSNIPIGQGLSSSAALEVTTLLTCLKHCSTHIKDPIKMAQICQWAEHHYASVPCGLMDQISVLVSQESHANALDFKDLSYEHVPISKSYRFIIVNSGASHQLVDGAYEECRQSCEAAAKKLNIISLRDITPHKLKKEKNKLSELEYKRAWHVVTENERVQKAHHLLQQQEMNSFGELMFESHESSRVYFENSCEELDMLIHFAKSHQAALGARLTGGGFGGAAIILVRDNSIKIFKEDLHHFFKKHYGKKAMLIDTCPAAGACAV